MHPQIIESENLSLDLLRDLREAFAFTHFLREMKSLPEPPERRIRVQNAGTRRPHESVERSYTGMCDEAGYDSLKRARFGYRKVRRGFEVHPDVRKSRELKRR